jgi:hypothetical protein
VTPAVPGRIEERGEVTPVVPGRIEERVVGWLELDAGCSVG